MLLDLYLYCEQLGVNGLAEFHDGKRVFNDEIWRADDGNFQMKVRIRRALGLKPLNFRRPFVAGDNMDVRQLRNL